MAHFARASKAKPVPTSYEALMLAITLLLAAAPTATPAGLEALFEKVDPSVVTVRVGLKRLDETSSGYRLQVGVGMGAGVVLHSDGFVATAAHVVDGSEGVWVDFQDGTTEPADIVTLSRTEDVALLKVWSMPKGVAVATLGNSDAVKPGQSVFAIGAPLGLGHSLTAGVVSSVRHGPHQGLMPGNVIQTDAALNTGNSGGALFNAKGEVVGIASYIASTSGGSQGLGFAVPSNVVRERLFEHPLPYLGVSLRHLPPPVTKLFNWPYPEVMLIEVVRPKSAADEAGLIGGQVDATIGGSEVRLGGDVIVKVNGHEAGEVKAIGQYLDALKEGDQVQYTVLRGGKLLDVSVKVPKRIPVPKLKK